MSGRELTAESEALLRRLYPRRVRDGAEVMPGFMWDKHDETERDLRSIEAAAVREALPSVEEMAAALDAAYAKADVGELPRVGPTTLARLILGALRAARASDGGR